MYCTTDRQVDTLIHMCYLSGHTWRNEILFLKGIIASSAAMSRGKEYSCWELFFKMSTSGLTFPNLSYPGSSGGISVFGLLTCRYRMISSIDQLIKPGQWQCLWKISKNVTASLPFQGEDTCQVGLQEKVLSRPVHLQTWHILDSHVANSRPWVWYHNLCSSIPTE